MKLNIVGRKIVKVKLNKFRSGRGLDGKQEWTSDPEIFLDDGSILGFVVAETETGGEYGIEICHSQPAKTRAKRRKP